ncbi:hypothetical protein KEM54_005887, partial [Ascosphaera aggregata]
MSALPAARVRDCAALRTTGGHSSERTWAQVAAQVSQQPLTSAIQSNPISQIRKTAGTVCLAQKAKGRKVEIPRTFVSVGKAAPAFTCSPLSSPSESRQSSVSSTTTIVLPLGSTKQRKYTYAQASGDRSQYQPRGKKGERTLGLTCKSNWSPGF